MTETPDLARVARLLRMALEIHVTGRGAPRLPRVEPSLGSPEPIELSAVHG